jgi:hypothetical protein
MTVERSSVAAVLVAVAVVGISSLSTAQSATPPSAPSAVSSAASPAPAGASSPSPADKEEAAARYKRGLELYAEENYRGALIEFRKAYQLTGQYRVLYNVGQVCYQLQDYVCAVESFETYLKLGTGELTEKRTAEVMAEIAKLRPRIAKVTIESNVPGVDISIDDIPRGTTPFDAVRLSEGSHKLVASKEGKLPITRQLDVAGAETQTIKLELMDAAGGQVVIRDAPAAPQSRWTTLSYVGLGTGGALAVGAGVAGFIALSSASSLKSAQYVGPADDSALSLQRKVQTSRLAADVLAGAAILTVGATLFFTLSHSPEESTATSSARVTVGVGPGSFSIAGAF